MMEALIGKGIREFMRDSRKLEKVSGDMLIPLEYEFAPLSCSEVANLFDLVHRISECFYAGRGVWICDLAVPYPPSIRTTSRRVIGYLGAYAVTGKEIYKTRAWEGLLHLLEEQYPSGEFNWYRGSTVGVQNRDDGLYEAGIAGVAFLEGYRTFGQERFLLASARAADWALECPTSWNYNYNMFSVWHLSRHYSVTGDKRYFDGAVEKVLTTLAEQKPNGRWEGHNSWIWYHGIILRGLAELYSVLPESHELKERVRECIIRAVNRLIIDEKEDGSVPPNPDESEARFKDPNRNIHRNAFILQALSMVYELVGIDVKGLINGLLHFRASTEVSEDLVRSLGDFQIISGSWADRLRRSPKLRDPRWYDLSLPGEEEIWKADLSTVESDGQYGSLPKGWEKCWYPMHDPKVGSVRVEPDSGDALKICLADSGIRGIGFDLSKNGITLETGHRYRFCVTMKFHDLSMAEDLLQAVILSTYSGKPRDFWDMATGCEMASCRPLTRETFDAVLWFTPKSDETNYLYVSFDSRVPQEQTSVCVHIYDAHLVDEGDIVQSGGAKLPFDDYDCSIMALGEYMARCCNKSATAE